MKKISINLIVTAFFTGLAFNAWAGHGVLTSTERDPWVNQTVQDLVDAGLVVQPQKPVGQLTNLEVAQLTHLAVQSWLSQDQEALTSAGTRNQGPEPAVSRSLQKLADEFQDELITMGQDMAQLEDRLYDSQHRNEIFKTLQQEYLKRTGTSMAGYARGYFNTYRGSGINAPYGPWDNNDILLGDLILKSIPVPFLLFNTDLRVTRTNGLIYADPINPTFNLRWISLTYANELANFTAGDFFRSYTPLTLWNYEIPVYTLIEPTSYQRVRNDIEGMIFMDHGPNWHMRGFEGTSDRAVTNSDVFSSFHLQAMGGILTPESQYLYANDYAGSEAALDLFGDKLEFKGAGYLLWVDTNSVNYISGLTPNGEQYQVGSLSAKGTLPLGKSVTLSANGEYASSYYQDDANQNQNNLKDWAVLAGGSLDFEGALLSVKYLSNGPNFYSPGAQTNRFSPVPSTAGYLNGNQKLDDGLSGYLDNYVFQGVGQPVFAPFDRMAENILPYGDSTPNREGLILGLKADLGKGGWLKPQASMAVNMHEVQPDILTVVEHYYIPADSQINTIAARKFGGYEGALVVDLGKVLEGAPKTCALSGDYKHQSVDLGTGANPFTLDSYIASADIGPFPHVPLFEGLVLSASFEQAKSSGSEFVLSEPATILPTLAEYASYYDTSLIGSYIYQPLDFTRTSWAFGFKCNLSRTFELHGDWFINKYTWSDVPGYDRREQIWRLSTDVSF